ncbi:hypothetical protein D3C76_837530 [compost metagenome]
MFEYLRRHQAATGQRQQDLIRRNAGVRDEPCCFDRLDQALAGSALSCRAAPAQRVAQAPIGQAHGRTVAGAHRLHAQ